jgi:kynurenine formamidase
VTEYRAPFDARGGALVELSHVIRAGTYLGSPYHRYPGGGDLAAMPLERTADLPAVVVRVRGTRQRGIDVDDTRFGSPAYAQDAHFLTEAGAAWLAGQQPALVGIDAVNIDDTADGRRPAHSLLLAAGIPVVEHLTGLGQLPPAGAWFTAAPLRIEGFGTIPVRAFARLPG